MNNTMDRRGFLKAMLVIAGSLVAPSLVSAGPRESVYVPKVKKITASEYGRAVPFTEESINILNRFDPDDPIQVELRQQIKSTFQWAPDVHQDRIKAHALSKELHFQSIASTRMLFFAKPVYPF